jgi:hypothetical protein
MHWITSLAAQVGLINSLFENEIPVSVPGKVAKLPGDYAGSIVRIKFADIRNHSLEPSPWFQHLGITYFC